MDLSTNNGPTSPYQGLGLQPSAGGRPAGAYDSQSFRQNAMGTRAAKPPDPYSQYMASKGGQKGPWSMALSGGPDSPLIGIIQGMMSAIKDPGFLQQLQHLIALSGGGQ